ncbi:RNA-processing protein [Candidatus Woesearchaeota archaeon]|nr:RNA-processing protein [Candidatus Woesearchaeota archaeon]
MYEEEIIIPKDRVGVFIGKYGKLRKELEKITKTSIKVDSENNIITLKSEDSLSIFNATPIIKAIARGFNPEIAQLLSEEDHILEIIDIKDYSGNSKKKLIRLRSRCIGTSGKARQEIEQLTNTNISIYGKTISIIGRTDDVDIAKDAMESILLGAPHGKVYRKIQERKNKLINIIH